MVDLAKFKGIFVSEAEDQLETLNACLLKIEKNIGNADQAMMKPDLNELMRAAHTIKGSSASMGYVKMAFLAHVLEDIFDSARNDRLTLTIDLVNSAFAAIDNLEKSLESIKKNSVELDFDAFSEQLKITTGVSTNGFGKSVRNEAQPAKTTAETGGNEAIKTADEAGTEMQEKKTQKIVESQENETPIIKVEHIKVPVKRLDVLLDLVEELLIDKMRLEEVSSKYEEVKDISSSINLLVSGIQYEIMQARMVPVEQVFARFPRMVRDIANKENKVVNFIVNVGDIELDRTIVDKLGEPLIHLLRNAVDHGIKKSGTVKLEAIRKSESVAFIVENDGGGIDLNLVREAAVSRGFATQGEIINYTEDQLFELLFDPNFSTNKVITEISGRGVGLSVVKKFVETFSGKVNVENSDSGVRFIMELPQSLAIIEALLISAGAETFAIPFSNIVRSVSIPPNDIKKMGDHDMAMVDGINIPLVDLSIAFSSGKDEQNSGKTEEGDSSEKTDADKNIIAVLIKNEDELAGIVVDRLIGEQEVIVKPFSSILHGIKGFSGSTILGDGKVSLILDAAGLLKNIKNS